MRALWRFLAPAIRRSGDSEFLDAVIPARFGEVDLDSLPE
jgi:hypothetical protein